MKKKLALLLAAIMTVAMVPMTAFASTKLTAVDEISTAVGDDHVFTSVVELSKNDDQVNIPGETFQVILKLTNGKFAKDKNDAVSYTHLINFCFAFYTDKPKYIFFNVGQLCSFHVFFYFIIIGFRNFCIIFFIRRCRSCTCCHSKK